MIQENIITIKERVGEVCQQFDSEPEDVTLVGVTKFAEVPEIRQALESGITIIAENKVQEGQRKFPELRAEFPELKCHLIGHLQTNKAKLAVELFDMIESVDSVRLAKTIDEEARKIKKVMPVLLQVNTSGEEQKFGFTPSDLMPAIKEMVTFPNIRIKGLMTIAPLSDDQERIRHTFADLRMLFQAVASDQECADGVEMLHLSMGMTQDFELAIEEGSNMVRIGSALFKA